MSFLAPEILVRYIPSIALLLGIVVLVLFIDKIHNYIIFPLTNWAKTRTSDKIKTKLDTKHKNIIAKYSSEGAATIIFLAYCFFGEILLAHYIFEPILEKLRSIILIVVIALFFVVSYIINNERIMKFFYRH